MRELDTWLKKYGREMDSFENTLDYDEYCESATQALQSYINKQLISELEYLRTRYSAFTWGYYDPFQVIDDRIESLKGK